MRMKAETFKSAPAALATIQEIPICRKIAVFLLRNSEAADTVRGIAEWWIQEDVQVTQMALDRLLEAGVVRVHSTGGMTFYSLSEDRVVRRTLRKMLRQSSGDRRGHSKVLAKRLQAQAE